MSAVTFASAMEDTARLFEVCAAFVLVAGLVAAPLVSWRAVRRGQVGRSAFARFREVFGGAILLALEIFVAADLLNTVTVHPTMENVLVLLVIVVIRTVLSFSLEVEIEGTLPWRKALVSGGAVMAEGVRRSGGGGGPRG